MRRWHLTYFERLWPCSVLVAAVIFTFVGSIALADTFTPEQLAQRAIERRAVEAVIWGMPAVNYDLMRQEMLDPTDAEVNQVIYWGRPLDWMNQTLTPNPDTMYFMAFFDTTDGPVVMDIPPADGGSLNGNIVTAWQMPLEDVGLLGVDKGAGVRLAILPPGYGGAVPSGSHAPCSPHLRRLCADPLEPGRATFARRRGEVARLCQAR